MNKYLRLIRLDRPIGIALHLWPTLSALFIANNKLPPILLIVVFSVGVFLTRSMGCVINDFFDAKFDRHVLRTKDRVLANNTLPRSHAILIFIALAISAFILAVCFLSKHVLLLSIPTVVLIIIYPLMKRIFFVPQAYLGILLGFSVIFAFVQINGTMNVSGYIFFASYVFWVLGYDTIYALVDKPYDLSIGIKTSAITFGKFVAPMICLCYLLYIALLIVLGLINHYIVWYYILLISPSVLIIWQLYIVFTHKETQYFKAFSSNQWVGMLVFIACILATH